MLTILFRFSAPHGAGMVESLAMKTTTWENERGIEFTYDGVSINAPRPPFWLCYLYFNALKF